MLTSWNGGMGSQLPIMLGVLLVLLLPARQLSLPSIMGKQLPIMLGVSLVSPLPGSPNWCTQHNGQLLAHSIIHNAC